MVSQTAKEDIEAMLADGLKPSVNDIVRLNVLGLKMENSKNPAEELYYLPRCAFLGDVIIYQPTIGHDIWLSKMEAYFDTQDLESSFAITAYACTFADYEQIPTDLEEVAKGLIQLKQRLAKFTAEQVIAAVKYVVSGTFQDVNEFPSKHDDEEDEPPVESGSTPCASIGILYSGIALGMNISIQEAKKLTRSQLESMRDIALSTSGRIDKKKLQGSITSEYFATLTEIRQRLQEGMAKDGK